MMMLAIGCLGMQDGPQMGTLHGTAGHRSSYHAG